MLIYNKHVSRDAEGCQDWYEAISVIEYKGRLSSTGDSQGHYMCDIKDNVTNRWFRTNDNSPPFPVRVSDVSQYGYVVLFKRV